MEARSGDYEKAAEHIEGAAILIEPPGTPAHSAMQNLHRTRALFFWLKGESAAAIEELERAIPLMEARFGKDSPELVEELVLLGSFRVEVGRPGEALATLERAIELMKPSIESHRASMQRALSASGRAQLALGKIAAARASLERALAPEWQQHLQGMDRVRANFALAKILWRDPATRPRAIEGIDAALRSLGEEPPHELRLKQTIAAWRERHRKR
jgi:tetratricopeptide (TPR) repeat protein